MVSNRLVEKDIFICCFKVLTWVFGKGHKISTLHPNLRISLESTLFGNE